MNKFENGGDEISSDFPLFLGLSGKGKKKDLPSSIWFSFS